MERSKIKNTEFFFKESRSRSLVKAFIYRFIATIGTGTLIWFITKDIREVISATIIIQVFLMILYYFNERIWNKISWGRARQKE
jgi:uncharacterized membrane protein